MDGNFSFGEFDDPYSGYGNDFANTSSYFETYQDPFHKTYVGVTVVWCVWAFPCILANIAVIFLFCKKQNKEDIDNFVISLATCDILYLLLSVTFFSSTYLSNSWVLGDVFCRIYGYFIHVLPHVMGLTMMLMAFERFAKNVCNSRMLCGKINCVAAWIVPGIVCLIIPLFLTETLYVYGKVYCYVLRANYIQIVYLIGMLSCYGIPVCLIIACFVGIAISSNKPRPLGVQTEIDQNQTSSESTATFVVGVLSALFVLFWLPMIAYQFYLIFLYFPDRSNVRDRIKTFYLCAQTATIFKSGTAPFVYFFKLSWFRKKVLSFCRSGQ